VQSSVSLEKRMETRDPLIRTTAEVVKLWSKFRGGDAVRCPKCNDHGSMALAVEGFSKSYRLVCTECGLSTPWFEPRQTPIGIDLVLKFDGDSSEVELPDE
jgi:transcription elongation factor Elf1